jgi:hypothetical protein
VQGFLRVNLLNSGLQDQAPVAGEAGIPAAKNLRFARVKVTDVPVLVDGVGVHPAKPVEGFVLDGVTGTCKAGVKLANMKGVVLKGIEVTGFEGPRVTVANVTGEGLEGAAMGEGPKVPEAAQGGAAATEPYRLR